MDQFYLGGFYLIQPILQTFADKIERKIYTCSRCLNITLFDNWCLNWMNDQLESDDLDKLGIDTETVKLIQTWTEKRFDIGSNVFPNKQIAIEYRILFFENHKDVNVLGLYFDRDQTEVFLDDFGDGKNVKEFNHNSGNFPLYQNLSKKTLESKNLEEQTLGFDLIGIECDGSFHSIYCNFNPNEIREKLGLEINSYGLFDKPKNNKEIVTYLNDPKNGLEPLPWYIVKVKRFGRASC